MSNPLVTRAGNLQLLKKELLANPEKEEQLVEKVLEIFQTPFSMKKQIVDETPDQQSMGVGVNEGFKDLAHLHGFSDMTDEARRLLQLYCGTSLGRILRYYEVSQVRREEGLQTAFKSSLQHALIASNIITHPDQLHKHMMADIRSPALKIANWWEKYLIERAEIIRKEVEVTAKIEEAPKMKKAVVRKRKLKGDDKTGSVNKKSSRKTKKEVTVIPEEAVNEQQIPKEPVEDKMEKIPEKTEVMMLVSEENKDEEPAVNQSTEESKSVETKKDEEETSSQSTAREERPAARRRGRPKKNPIEPVEKENKEEEPTVSQSTKEEKSVACRTGRPKKNPRGSVEFRQEQEKSDVQLKSCLKTTKKREKSVNSATDSGPEDGQPVEKKTRNVGIQVDACEIENAGGAMSVRRVSFSI